MPVDPLPTAEAMVAELRRAVARGEEGAGTLPAKEAVKVRPADWHRLTAGARRAAALIEQQADEIESLERRVQIAEDHATAAEENVSDLTEDLAQAKDEIERLRGALAPFAKAASIRLCGGDDYWTADKRIQGTDIAFHITFGDLHRAAAALSPVEKEKGR